MERGVEGSRNIKLVFVQGKCNVFRERRKEGNKVGGGGRRAEGRGGTTMKGEAGHCKSMR